MAIFYTKTLQPGGQNMFIRFFRTNNGTQPLQSFVLAFGQVDSPEKLAAQVFNLSMLARKDVPELSLTTDAPVLIV